jgi:hypothetical protein
MAARARVIGKPGPNRGRAVQRIAVSSGRSGDGWHFG